MSVPSWARKQAKGEFVYKIYLLNLRIGEICANKPKKYKASYGDIMIKAGLEALKNAQIGNMVHMNKDTTEENYAIRRRRLKEAQNLVTNISTTALVFLSLVEKNDQGASCYDPEERKAAEVRAKKIHKEMEDIGLLCEESIKMIGGVLKSDANIYRKGNKKNSEYADTFC